jgi:hypothetical protein
LFEGRDNVTDCLLFVILKRAIVKERNRGGGERGKWLWTSAESVNASWGAVEKL